ncbi:MAG: ATP-binding cassette domain-containing protein, partial [Candidatus Limisoma sp.]|nr:ATP-binding cassette domain-containing protein [Bacteroidales bacterium]MDY5894687.1 ATP-binding cassette domain-containing protein [Candidatus Limisoma sp.]
MITISGLKVEFGSNLLFGDVSFSIGDKERIALTGRNGAGKSTLLKIIAGLQKPTSGVVAIPTDATVGYLPQQMNVTDNRTVMEEVKTVFGEVDRLRSRLDEVNARLAEATDSESDEYARLVDQMTALNEAILLKESNNYIAEIEKTLIGLGFVRSDFERMTSEFSGGWRMRIELAKLLLRRPDVLLLDEPTNHLDIESIQWLESFLRQKAKAVVLVSHDRAFLDNVTQRTIEISCGKIYDYAVNYSKFVELRRERVEQQLRAYRNQQKQIEETEDFI